MGKDRRKIWMESSGLGSEKEVMGKKNEILCWWNAKGYYGWLDHAGIWRIYAKARKYSYTLLLIRFHNSFGERTSFFLKKKNGFSLLNITFTAFLPGLYILQFPTLLSNVSVQLEFQRMGSSLIFKASGNSIDFPLIQKPNEIY